MILNWLKQKFLNHFCSIRVSTVDGKEYKAVIDDSGLSGDISYSYAKTRARNLRDIFMVDTIEDWNTIPSVFREELIYYLSYIQDKFDKITTKCKKGIYFREDLGIELRLLINPIKHKEAYPSTDAFLLVKWFTEIQCTGKVPKELEEYIAKEMALEILEG